MREKVLNWMGIGNRCNAWGWETIELAGVGGDIVLAGVGGDIVLAGDGGDIVLAGDGGDIVLAGVGTNEQSRDLESLDSAGK